MAWAKRRSRRSGAFGLLLEGDKLLREALDLRLPVEAVWYVRDFTQRGRTLLDALRSRGFSLREVPARTMAWISDLETPPGLAAVTAEPRFDFQQPDDPFALIVALAMVQDPGNLGAIIRTCDFFGVDELWLGPESADPFSPKTVRGSMGSALRLPVRKLSDLLAQIACFAAAGAEVWAAVPHDETASFVLTGQGKRILLMGGESRGLNPSELEAAPHRISIPGAGRAESLNLAVAAGILIHAATGRRYHRLKD